jgi:alcohol dehydrogenase
MYAELLRASTRELHAVGAAEGLALRLSAMATAGKLPKTLREAGATKDDLSALASEAAQQWTGTFNPRPFDAHGALEIYQCAF